MPKKNVLVFPCGSEIGLEIYRSVCFSTHFELWGGSSEDDHGQFVYKNYIPELPYVNDRNFIEAINATVKAHDIAAIFPAHDEVALRLSEASDKGLLACDVISSSYSTNQIVRSKRKTYEYLQLAVETPRVYGAVGAIPGDQYPIFMKPNVGQGSKGTHVAQNSDEAIFYLNQNPSLLLLEYLPGKEYTIDCFTDRHGAVRFVRGRQRKRISNGISVSSMTTKDSRFRKMAEKINEILELRGVWFFQVKERSNGELVLMEVAVRVAGTMGLVRCAGVNLPLLNLFDWMGYDVDIFENDVELTIDRALASRYTHNLEYEHVYIDFDDLIIFNNRVNTQIVAFLYQCLNKGIKLHLITKHKQDLNETLKKYRLGQMFDEIIWIQDGSLKPSRITETKAIFIDDSHAERASVHKELGLPVFDSHMIEALMEKD